MIKFVRSLKTSVRKFFCIRRFKKVGANLSIGLGSKVNYGLLQGFYGASLQIGERCIIAGQLGCQKQGALLEVGGACFIGAQTSIVATECVSVGKNVLIAHGCYITDTDGHSIDAQKRMLDVENRLAGKKDWDCVKSSPIKIGDLCWIGPSVIILKGVSIGNGTIVGAGSVVTRSLPEYVFAAGNPAKIIRTLEKG
jgi:galactoside O-acetyltransferase